jgi:F420 biosynthesis protein FbiB-like protein
MSNPESLADPRMGAISNLQSLLTSRRSIRRYQTQPVPQEEIRAILEAALWAPSAHNRQPWRFAVVSTPDTRERLARAMGQRLRMDLERDGVPADFIDKDTRRSYERISQAPVIIVVCLSMEDMDAYPDSRRQAAEHLMAVQSVAMAVQNLLLAAHARGLGACWMCAPLFCPDVVRRELDLPETWEALALITLGYPAGEGKNRGRAPLETKARFL